MVRASAGPHHPVPYRHLGAVLVLRDARHPGLLHGRATRPPPTPRVRGVRLVHGVRLLHSYPGRSHFRPLVGTRQGRPDRGLDHGRRSFHDGLRTALLCRTRDHRDRQRAIPAQPAESNQRSVRTGRPEASFGLQLLLRRGEPGWLPCAARCGHRWRVVRLALGFHPGRSRHALRADHLPVRTTLPPEGQGSRPAPPGRREQHARGHAQALCFVVRSRRGSGRLSSGLRAGRQHLAVVDRAHAQTGRIFRHSHDLVPIPESVAHFRAHPGFCRALAGARQARAGALRATQNGSRRIGCSLLLPDVGCCGSLVQLARGRGELAVVGRLLRRDDER